MDKEYLELETWCRRRVRVLQNEHLAEIAKKSLTSQVTRKLNPLKPDAEVDETNDVDEAPSWVKEPLAAIKCHRCLHPVHGQTAQIVVAVQVAEARPAVMDRVTAANLLLQGVRSSSIGATSATTVGLMHKGARNACPSRR